MPELDEFEIEFCLEYLVTYLQEIGPCESEGPITWRDIEAWCNLTGAALDDFDVTALRQMSIAYFGMMHAAKKADCPCPVRIEQDEDESAVPDDEQKKRVSDGISKAFGAMADRAEQQRTGKRSKGMARKTK